MQRGYAHGGDIYTTPVELDFSANVNPLGMPLSVREAAQAAITDCVRYPDPHCRCLRMALAKKEELPPEWLIFGNGAADLIYRFALAYRPKLALIPAPTFSEYEKAVRSVGADVRYHTLLSEQGFCFDEKVLDMLTDEVDVLFLCNPNNPTGQLIEPSLLAAVMKRCAERHIFLFLDECFLDFLPDGTKQSQKAMLKKHANFFLLRAFTKLYGMAGLRLGYGLCANTELLQRMVDCAQAWPVSVPAQAAGVAALEEDAFVERTHALIVKERAYLTKELNRLDIPFFPPAANYILFCYADGLYEVLLQRGILIRSCHTYPGLGTTYYRIAVRTHAENIRLIAALEEVGKGELQWQNPL